MPGTVEAAPLDLVMDRSALGVRLLVSVATMGVPHEGVAVAVLTREPVDAGLMVPVTV